MFNENFATLLTTLSALFATSIPHACLPAEPGQCERSSDCRTGQLCRMTQCVTKQTDTSPPEPSVDARSNQSPVTEPPSPDADTPQPVRCEEGRPPKPGELVINEVLANVPTGLAGDANNDGERDPYADEFIEFVNGSDVMLDLHDVAVVVDDEELFSFAGRCLPVGHAIVLFGGTPLIGSPDDAQTVGVAGLGLTNSGGDISVMNPADEVVDDFSWTDAPGESHTLTPQISGDAYKPHTEMSDKNLFSPGRCPDGKPISSGC